VVVELKRAKATQETVHQSPGYAEAAEAVLTFLPPSAVVRGVLAAPSISRPP